MSWDCIVQRITRYMSVVFLISKPKLTIGKDVAFWPKKVIYVQKRFNRPHNYKSRRPNLTFIHTIYVSNLNFTDCFGSKDVTVIY